MHLDLLLDSLLLLLTFLINEPYSYPQFSPDWSNVVPFFLLKCLRDSVVQKNPGDGLVLTRGQWSWDIQEEGHYQFKGLMQYYHLLLTLVFLQDLQTMALIFHSKRNSKAYFGNSWIYLHNLSARRFCNTSNKFELFVPEVSAKLQLLSNSSLDSITATVQVRFPICTSIHCLVEFVYMSHNIEYQC